MIMADVHSNQIRHYNMSCIRSKDTKPETLVRKYLFSQGLRYRKNDKRYPGCPDIVLPKFKAIVFVHGCFWHMHEGNTCFVMPTTNAEYLVPKLQRNKQRDAENIMKLKNDGWNVIIVWECELKKARRDQRLNLLYQQITGCS